MRIDPSNTDQLNSWDGEGGENWTNRADRFDHGVAGYGDAFFTAAAIEDGANILDIGCGSGPTTRAAARRAGSGSVLGVDLSTRQLELARETARREGLENVHFEQADAQIHQFPEASFDLVISRHGLMFFGDPVTAFGNIAWSMRANARLVALTWQPFSRNAWLRSFFSTLLGEQDPTPPPNDRPSPLSLSEPERVHGLLESAGFADVRLDDLRAPMYYGSDVEDAFSFIIGSFGWLVREFEPSEQQRAHERLRADIAEHLTEDGVCYESAAWLVTARRPG